MADFGLTIRVTEGTNDGPPIPNAVATGVLAPATTDAAGNAVIDGLYLTVGAQGYWPYEHQFYHRPSLQGPITVSLQPKPLRPPIPTRDQVCSVRLTFQGLTVETADHGTLPWFEAALTSLSAGDRARVYAAKHAAGDTHCIVALTWRYNEPGQPYQAIEGRDLSKDLPAFRALIEEVVQAGFIAALFLGGDGQGAGPGYNNDVGWSYGADWAIAELPAVIAAVGDLWPYCLFVPGWDSVFYGWTVKQLADFGAVFRKHLPAGHLGIEHNTGHIPCGNGPADYGWAGAMRDYDVILSEYDANLHQDSCWQINGRLEHPYVRPNDQPPGDDMAPPFYLKSANVRGAYFHCAFEWAEYDWVRGRISAADVEKGRQYLKAQGCKWTG